VAYVACEAVVDAENQALYEGTYGEGADCWQDDAKALACTKECQAGLQAATAQDPTVSACWIDGQPDMRLIFPTAQDWALVLTNDGRCSSPRTMTFSSGSTADYLGIYEDETSIHDWQCTETGLDWTCPPAGDGDVVSWTGSFEDGFRAGTMRITVAYPSTTTPSTDTGPSAPSDVDCAYSGTPK
jgi:hypothetical protein